MVKPQSVTLGIRTPKDTEAIMSWPGKHPLTSVDYWPAKLREVYAKQHPASGWLNKIFLGENLSVMAGLLAEFHSQFNLIYLDPPFNSKASYQRTIRLRGAGGGAASFRENQYRDTWTDGAYLQFIYQRLIVCRELLDESGSIYLHCDWHASHQLRMLLDEVFGPKNFLNEIVWSYGSGGGRADRFSYKHDTLLCYAKHAGSHQFNPDAVRVPYSAVIADKRADKFDPRGKYCPDVWVIPRPPNHSSQWVGYPTQKPAAVIERVLKASSNPGDLVLDPFLGSGTLAASATRLGRRFVGVDANPAAVQIAIQRLLNDYAEMPKPAIEVYFSGTQNSLDARPADVEIGWEGSEIVVYRYCSPRLLERFNLDSTGVGDWRQLVDTIMIDFNYDGEVLRPEIIDIPGRDSLVAGRYQVPQGCGVVRVKITNVVGETLEVDLPT